MPTGALTSNIDVAQVVLYAFWIFFAGLIFYLRREDKREGYPLESDRTDRTDRVVVQGFPAIPSPKTFHLPNGETRFAPRDEGPAPEIAAKPVGNWPGAPLQPTGNPMVDGVGPASYARRSDVPEMTYENEPKVVPIGLVEGFSLDSRDVDPRGLQVIGADDRVAGTVRDVWVDRSEPMIRYLDVELAAQDNPRHVLLPMGFAIVRGGWSKLLFGGRQPSASIKVDSIASTQFADVPATKSTEQISMLEEDMITAYYASGHLYATPSRSEPLI